jgi:membrane-associated protease RseP (regulator of RpoE activity)
VEPLPPPGPWSSPVGPRRRGPWLNVLLFAATALTTLATGAHQAGALVRLDWNRDPGGFARETVLFGLPYATAILGILLSHELGHYLMARAWKVDATLPFFVPGIPPVGTFGAVIRMRSAIPSRRAILDIGAAGPIGGFLVALPLLLWSVGRSAYVPAGDAFLPSNQGSGLWQVARAWLEGQPAAASAGAFHLGDSLLTAWAKHVTLGPMPPAHVFMEHPVYLAAWFGLFVTTLNLLPIGQLDGGHVLYALLGRRGALTASRAVSWGLLAAGVFLSWNWLLWWAITRFLVRLGHPPALDDAPLDRSRVAVALLSLLLFAVTFVPVPVTL